MKVFIVEITVLVPGLIFIGLFVVCPVLGGGLGIVSGHRLGRLPPLRAAVGISASLILLSKELAGRVKVGVSSLMEEGQGLVEAVAAAGINAARP